MINSRLTDFTLEKAALLYELDWLDTRIMDIEQQRARLDRLTPKAAAHSDSLSAEVTALREEIRACYSFVFTLKTELQTRLLQLDRDYNGILH